MFAFCPAKRRFFVLMSALLGSGVLGRAQQADMVLVHGTVLTEDARDSVAQAVAIRGGAIVAVGTDKDVMKLVGPKTRVIDLKGRTATPGMIDTHSHYAEAGADDLFGIQLSDATSIAEIVGRVEKRVATAKPGEWIVGTGWDEGKLKERRYVLAADLDAVSPKNPVVLRNTSGHYSTLNHVAMQLAGITDAIKDPVNGKFDRDQAGHLTGVLEEGAQASVQPLIPRPTADQIRQGVLKEIDDLHREGVTGFKDTATMAQWDVLDELNAEGKLDERVCILLRAGPSMATAETTLKNLQRISPVPRTYKQGRLAACGAKIFMDGSIGPRTAWSYEEWMKDGVAEAGNMGFPNLDPEVYRAMVRMFHQAGITVGTHAIGDRAVDWVVDTYAAVEKEKPMPGLRHSIIHAMLVTPHAIDAMAALQKDYDAGYPEVQPIFLWWRGVTMASAMDAGMRARLNPLKTMLEHHVRWSMGTDYGVAPLAARYGLWSAVVRESGDGTRPFGMAEAVDVKTALRGYTAWAAPALFLEKEVGTLEVGKRADIAVWDKNPLDVAAGELKGLECEMTLVDGKVVFAR